MEHFNTNILGYLFLLIIFLITIPKHSQFIKPLIGFLIIFTPIILIVDSFQVHILVIGLLIVFQKEIRRVVNELGNKTLFFISNNSLETSTETIIESLNYLSRNNTGAIIVIKQRDNIPECNGGIPLESLCSTPLILSIFNEYSPLHDGAILINENNIETARLILPLSSNENLNRYGTRHRAGMGLSELCDAKVIVVSEETGSISYFHNQKFIPNISLEDLKDRLAGIN